MQSLQFQLEASDRSYARLSQAHKSQRRPSRSAFVGIIDYTKGLAITATLRSTRARTTSATTATPTGTTLLPTRAAITLRTLAGLIANRSIDPIEIRLLGNIIALFVEVFFLFARRCLDLSSASTRHTSFSTRTIGSSLRRIGQTELRSLFTKNCLPRELDAVALDRQHLHQDLIALTKLVLDLFHAMLCDLRDVQQAVRSREDLDKRAELGQTNHFAQIRLTNLRNSSQVSNHLDRARQTISIARSHIHSARIVNVDLHTGRIDDAPNHLAARSDQVTDLIGRNLQCVNPRSKLGLLFIRTSDRRIHRIQQRQPSTTSLLKGLTHDLWRDSHDLDVHLQCRNTLASTSHLEVHITIVILSARNIGENGILIALLHQPHSHTGNRSLNRNPSLHQRQRGSAHGSHRRRSIRLQNVGDDAQSIRRLIFSWQHSLNRSRSQSAMTNLTPTNPTHPTHFSNRERREVIVQHEATLLLTLIALQPLSIVSRTQSRTHQRLRLSASEQRRTVNARQNSNLNRDLTNLVKSPVVGTNALVQNLIAEDLLAQHFVILAELLRRRGISLGQILLQLILNVLDQRIAVELRMLLRVERVLQLRTDLAGQLAEIRLVNLGRCNRTFRLPCTTDQVLNRGADLLDLAMRKLDSIDDAVFGNFLRAGLDHHNAILGPHNHDVQRTFLTLALGRVHHELIIHESNPHSSYWPMEGNVAQGKRTARTIDSEHIRIILFISGIDKRNHLRLIPKLLWKQRTDRTVDLAARQNLLLAGTTFALDKSTRNAATRVGELAVLNRQGEEVNPFLRIRRSHSRCQNYVVAACRKRRARGLLRHPTCLKFNLLATGKLNCNVLLHVASLLFSLGIWKLFERAVHSAGAKKCSSAMRLLSHKRTALI